MTVRAMQIGVSGLRVDGEAIGGAGDNVAHVNTPGVKRQRAAFEDIFNRDGGGAAPGSGARLGNVGHAFSQGSLVQTGLGTDVALNGEGFFVVSGAVNGLTGTFYSRAGQFRLDASRTLVDPSGLRVMGKAMRPDGALSARVAPLTVPAGGIPAEPTTALRLVVNLDASVPPPVVPFDLQNPAGTANLATSMAVFDPLGAPHSLEIYFNKVAENHWEYRAVVAGDELNPHQPATNVEVGSGTLSFTSDGALDVFAPNRPISIDFAHAAPGQAVSVDFGSAIANGGTGLDGTTQFSMAGGVSSQTQNGYGSGALTGISIASDGTLLGLYDNGLSVPVGELQVAKFDSNDSLRRAANGLWVETPESGSAMLAAPGLGGRGQLSAGTGEMPNVDVAEDVSMIRHQRALCASSKVIATADDMLSRLMLLER